MKPRKMTNDLKKLKKSFVIFLGFLKKMKLLVTLFVICYVAF